MHKNDDLSELQTTLVQTHELYLELRNSGFTRGESLGIVARMIVQNPEY